MSDKSQTTEDWQPAETAPQDEAILGAFVWRDEGDPAGVHSIRWQPHWKAWVCSSVMIQLDTDARLAKWRHLPPHPEDAENAR